MVDVYQIKIQISLYISSGQCMLIPNIYNTYLFIKQCSVSLQQW